MGNLYKALFLIGCSLAAFAILKGAEYAYEQIYGTTTPPISPETEAKVEKVVEEVVAAAI
jgi:hypothetical protein